MVRVPLESLLSERSIVHPTIVKSVFVEGANLSLFLRGYNWWRARPSASEAEIEFLFCGISAGAIDLGQFSEQNLDRDEALEDFSVDRLTGYDWAQPLEHSIYCSAPLKQPYALYAKLHDYLVQRDSYRRPEDFLNTGNTLAQFIGTTSSDSYLLARCTDGIRSFLEEELIRQGVGFNTLSMKLPPDNRLLVRLGAQDFICTEAFAKFE